MNKKIIKNHIQLNFGYQNGRIYDKKDFQKALEEYQKRLIYEKRRKIIDKLLKFIFNI